MESSRLAQREASVSQSPRKIQIFSKHGERPLPSLFASGVPRQGNGRSGRSPRRPAVERTVMNPNKALWEKGDFTRIAATMRESGEELVQGIGVTPGTKVLDLGCGDGTT